MNFFETNGMFLTRKLKTGSITPATSFQHVPGHAIHEKGLQRQKCVGLLVSSQEQRALLVLLMNCG